MGKRVLIVEDDSEIRTMLQELLKSEGYEVDTASDGLIAWEKLVRRSENYEAILLDLTLPRMDGLQLIQALQKQKEEVLSSVIVLSADKTAIQQVVGMGVGHVLEKPFDLETVLALVSYATFSFPASSDRGYERE